MTLAVGDIAFVAYNHSGGTPEAVQFITLVDIPASEEIRFTDRGWRDPENDFFTGSGFDGVAIWTAPAAGVPAGTIVTINTNSGGAATGGAPGTVSGGANINLANAGVGGDQVIAFQQAMGVDTP
ncbi:MAG: hypothetical protein AAGF75_10095, partial [Cyanobacteria bacterium P01_H01_bin.130]